ncbi:YopT-type cysteine protease domain-containing protein [Actinobacillus arthritidis]|uniref:YopT-type cysteine protease domain-containing protein n=1 Tax=Actinobacillus arthritidis TaxID=157339 RepID=UPI002441AA0E|nr:YopT-type cysteine protease domain-containing protein [Actinobacillus arthritidis]WGE90215.1 YopT-type cysteine protease domain-containing protein [Actinobacillus arthritidis]
MVGGSAKQKVEFGLDVKESTQTSETRTTLGGKTNLVAREGDIELNNVETTEDSQLSLKAKENVNVNSGVTDTSETAISVTAKGTRGVSAGCGVMAQGCTVGVSGGISGGFSIAETESQKHQNSLLKGKSLSVATGKDFNLSSSNIDVDKLHLNVQGKTNVESKQDTYSRKEKGINYSASAGVGVSTSLTVKPNGSVGLGITVENEESKTVNKQAGISANKITGEINDLNLTGAYIENKGNTEEFTVKGKVSSKELKDSHHKDGGSFGGAFGISETGIAQLNLNGGRAEQRHYDAVQHSTLSGIKTDTVEGKVKNDRSQAKEVIRDDTYASTQFNFEVMDIVESGNRLKDKIKNKFDNRSSADIPSSNSVPKLSTPTDEVVYADVSTVQKATQSATKSTDSDYAEIAPRSVQPSVKADSDYEDISAFVTTAPKVKTEQANDGVEPIYAKVDKSPDAIAKANSKGDEAAKKLGDPRIKPIVQEEPAPELPPRNVVSRTKRSTPTDEVVYADVSTVQKGTQSVAKSADSDYAEIAPRSVQPSVKADSDYEDISAFVPTAPKAKMERANDSVEPIYTKVDKSPDAMARANERSDKAAEKLGDPRIKPVVQEDPAPELPLRNVVSRKKRSTPTDEVVYADISTVQKSTQSVAKSADNDYAEIAPRSVQPSVKADSDYEDISAFVTTAPKVKTEPENDGVEPIYAKVDKSPDAMAKANERSDKAAEKLGDPRIKPIVQEEPAPELPPRNYLIGDNANNNNNNNNNNRIVSDIAVQNSVNTASQTEKPSFFQKMKHILIGNKATKEKKVEKPIQKVEADLTKPNYDGLEDNLNLKGLLALEHKRNEDFDTKVLKNENFLNEAREATKKSIPDAVVKQMTNSPDFDVILTDGAKKVEKRINDTLTFRPKVEEFTEIQSLVKQLPKGKVIEDISEQTSRITDALAETSKTIQGNPKLKDDIGEAIGEFLKNSQNKELTVEMIEKLNHGLRPDEGENRTLYKKESLTKENAVFSSPEAAKLQLAETVGFINRAKQDNIEPSVLAGLVYQRLIAYHPFAEGNGRMARVIVNKLLLDAGYPAFTKFNEKFETQIIPQTTPESKTASSSEVVTEFLKELSRKTLPTKSYLESETSKPLDETSKHKVTQSDSAEIPTFSKTSLEYTENTQVEPIYAKIDKSAEAKAKAEERSDKAAQKLGDPRIKPIVQEEVAPELPPRPNENRATPVSDRVNKRELVEQPRSLLNKVKDTFQPLKVGHKIKEVRDSAKEFGGEVSFTFAQSKGKVYKEIIKHMETQNGVCESTCAHWIAKKVQEDQSLWNDLYDSGKEKKLNKETLDSIKKLQTEFINAGTATQQFKLTEEWLAEKGVVAKQKKVGEFSRKDEVSGSVSGQNIETLVKAIIDTGSDTTGIKKISINLKGGSHTVSVAVNGDKVVFFDPNFGEMTFPNKDQFAKWMEKAFWQKSGYAGTGNEKQFFNVVNYNL